MKINLHILKKIYQVSNLVLIKETDSSKNLHLIKINETGGKEVMGKIHLARLLNSLHLFLHLTFYAKQLFDSLPCSDNAELRVIDINFTRNRAPGIQNPNAQIPFTSAYC